jgi:hypothetical protein
MMASAELHLHRDGKATDAFVDLIWLTVGEVQAHVAASLVIALGVEAVAGDESHVFRQRSAK